MKNFLSALDKTDQRILIIAMGLSMILLSAGFFLLTVNKAYANHNPIYKVSPDVVGLGCDDSFVYYFNENLSLMKVPKSKAKLLKK